MILQAGAGRCPNGGGTNAGGDVGARSGVGDEPETRRVFVARHWISLPRFGYWRQQLRREQPRDRGRASFAPVHVVTDGAAPTSAALEIALTTGEPVIMPDGASGALLRTAASVLRLSC